MSVRIHSRVIVGALLNTFPAAREVLADHGVDFIDDDEQLPLHELADLYSLDVQDLIGDIEAALPRDARWEWDDEDPEEATG